MSNKEGIRTNPLEKAVWQHMERGRYLELSKTGGPLTEEEAKDWHFCKSWQGLLIHRTDPTFSSCNCAFREGSKVIQRPE